MTIFVSYARADEQQAERVAKTLGAAGYDVWRDADLPAHRAYAEVIEQRLKDARAVVVLWSPEAAKSQWVRAEADYARSAATLVQATLDGSVPPMPFNQIQCADLSAWEGRADWPGWRKLYASVEALAGRPDVPAKSTAARTRCSICVLPFHNMNTAIPGTRMRRAKDMPVFDSLDPAPENRCVTPLLDPGSPAQASLPTEQLPLSRSRSSPTRLRGPKVRWSFDRSGLSFRNRSPSKPKPFSVPRPFLGRPLWRPASFVTPHEEMREPRRA